MDTLELQENRRRVKQIIVVDEVKAHPQLVDRSLKALASLDINHLLIQDPEDWQMQISSLDRSRASITITPEKQKFDDSETCRFHVVSKLPDGPHDTDHLDIATSKEADLNVSFTRTSYKEDGAKSRVYLSSNTTEIPNLPLRWDYLHLENIGSIKELNLFLNREGEIRRIGGEFQDGQAITEAKNPREIDTALKLIARNLNLKPGEMFNIDNCRLDLLLENLFRERNKPLTLESVFSAAVEKPIAINMVEEFNLKPAYFPPEKWADLVTQLQPYAGAGSLGSSGGTADLILSEIKEAHVEVYSPRFVENNHAVSIGDYPKRFIKPGKEEKIIARATRRLKKAKEIFTQMPEGEEKEQLRQTLSLLESARTSLPPDVYFQMFVQVEMHDDFFDTDVITRAIPEREKTTENNFEPIAINFEVDPSFSEKEVLQATTDRFLSWLGPLIEEDLLSQPISDIKVWVFPEEQITQMNQRLTRLGFADKLGFKGEKDKTTGLVIRHLENNRQVEIFLPFGEKTTLAQNLNLKLGHELVHLAAGIKEGEAVTGEIGELIRKPIGFTEEKFTKYKQLLAEKGCRPVKYVSQGFTQYLEGVDAEGQKPKFLIYGDTLNEIMISFWGNKLANSDQMPQVAHYLTLVVDEEILKKAFVTGDINEVAEIFKEKTGKEFKKFCQLLDKMNDIKVSGRFSEESLEKARVFEDAALYILGSHTINP